MSALPRELWKGSLAIVVLETDRVYNQERIQRKHGETVEDYAERVKAAIIQLHKRLA